MDSQTIHAALGVLQADPDSADGWSSLNQAVLEPGGDLTAGDLIRLLNAACIRHRERGEFEAVALLLGIGARVVSGSEDEVRLLSELAQIWADELFDEERALEAYRRVLRLSPGYPGAAEAVRESERKREERAELAQKYLSEAAASADETYKAAMLMRAAELEVRFGEKNGALDAAAELLEQAVRLDPSNERAGRLLERIYRRGEQFEEAARVLERLADRGEDRSSRVSAGVRLARLHLLKLHDSERAVRSYERVLREAPSHPEAMSFLTEYYSSKENWSGLVGLFEKDLATRPPGGEQLGDMLQIALLHWRKRGRPEDAEPWFQRIQAMSPAHEAVLEFYREYCAALSDDPRLGEVLQAARAAVTDPERQAALSKELAAISARQKDAQKAIERCKSALRANPDDRGTREELKRLYKQTKGHNALLDLLRQELERTEPTDYAGRRAVLREVAAIYRQYSKSETALVSVLNQIVQLDDKLDEHDVEELRELVGMYARLERWRDLVTHQLKLADVSPDVVERIALYRDAARRWLEQFSNAQNAAEAYAKLLELDPTDHEARQRLEELYRKRRAWNSLYELYEAELARAEGAQRIGLMKELAHLAAESLHRGAEAIRWYREIVKASPGRIDVLEALERQAERAKDWSTVAEALEQHLGLLSDDEARVAVLQRLGRVYSDHLKDLEKAAGAWKRVLGIQPGNHRALRVLRDGYLKAGDFDGLGELYASQNDWEGLAEVLSNAADRASDADTRIQLSYRTAEIFEQKLGQPDRAFRSYERILAADPNDARAARALIPLYEADDKWVRIPALSEILVARASTADEKRALLERLVEISSDKLNDHRGAVAYARRIYELDPTRQESLGLLEQVSMAAERWDTYIDALEERLLALGVPGAAAESPAPEAGAPAAGAKAKAGKRKKKRGAKDAAQPISEPPRAGVPADTEHDAERYELLRRLARVQAKLGKTQEAGASYRRAIELRPADEAVLNEFEDLLRRAEDWEGVRRLFEHRKAHASATTERVAVLKNWADFEEKQFGDLRRARELYRQVLAEAPEDENAQTELPRVLLLLGETQDAVEALEGHKSRLKGDELLENEMQLAELYLTQLKDHSAALAAAMRALEERPDPRAISVLNRLMEVPETAARAAEVLASHYQAGSDARQEAHALRVLLDATTNPAEVLNLAHRLGTVYEEKLGAYGSALDVILQIAVRFPDDKELWDRAERLAAQAARPTDLAEALREVLRAKLSPETEIRLCTQAARVHEEGLGDPMGAAPYLTRVLEHEPGNDAAFERLKVTLTAGERWSELEQLYDRAANATNDPVRKTEMLIEVALITEEIMEGADKAVRYYERVLEVDENHEIAVTALDRMYSRLGQNEKLAGLLERRIERASGEDLLELKLRAARLELGLHQPERAFRHVEDVLHSRINDYEARNLAEQVLEIGDLRARAARLLEVVYDARNETRDLVRVLGIRLEEVEKELEVQASPEARQLRLELLRRIATLRDERMHDDVGAFDALTRLVPDDPLDLEARERLLEVGQRLEARERLTEVLSLAASHIEDVSAKGEILMQVAELHESMHASERAEAVYRGILALDDKDADLLLPAARALEAIYERLQRHAELAEMLQFQVRFEYDDQRRHALLARLGRLRKSALGNNQAAIEAWNTLLEEDPGNEAALVALDELYVATESWPELGNILERRAELVSSPADRRELLLRLASIQEKRLGRVNEAVETYQALLEQFGLDSSLLSALEALLESAERWHELADAMDRHLDVAATDAERMDLLARLGDLRYRHLSDSEGAFEAYRRAIDIDRGHARTRASVESLLTAADPVLRRQAAEILRPVYEAEGDHLNILRVLETQVDTSDDPLLRLEGLERLITVARDALEDPAKAFDYAKRAVREARGHAELAPWIRHLDELARAASRRAEQVELLRETVDEIFDGDVQLQVTLAIADLARTDLGDIQLARQYYEKALELRSDDKTALGALEAIFEASGAGRELHDVLVRRIEIAESDAERKALMHRRGRLLSEVLEDKENAILVYEALLDLGLDVDAIQALEKLYVDVQGWNELIHLYQRQLDAKAGSAVDLHVKIARVAAERQADLTRAFDQLEDALLLDPQHAGTIAELERLLDSCPEREDRARAAALLEPVYVRRADFDRLMRALKARLEASAALDERRELLTRLAKLYEEQYENYEAALETIAKLLHDDTGDEWTRGELERLAKVAGSEQRLAEIYAAEIADLDGDDSESAALARRAGELFAGAERFGEALKWYYRALAFEPENRSLFQAIDAILVRTKADEERVKLYRSSLDHRYEAAERLQALHTIAGLERDALDRVDDAIETYREALEIEDTDVTSLDALADLYTRRERWQDLADLYLSRAERSEHADVASKYRLLLANLSRDHLGDLDQALDQLETIVAELPTQARAIEALEGLLKSEPHKRRVVDVLRPLYEAQDDWRRLIVLNEDRFRLAELPAEKAAVLRETAELWEQRGADHDRARRALAAAVRIDPEDSALRAEFERVSAHLSAWDQLAEVYEAVLAANPELVSRRDILAVLANVHNVHRDDPRQALHAFDRLRAEDESDIEPLERMESLATLLSDWPTLVRVLTAKADLVVDDAERAATWRAVAETKRDMLEDAAGAVQAYERALEFAPDHAATLDALIELYEKQGAAQRLAELYEQRVDNAQEDEKDLVYLLLNKAAKCYSGELGDRRRAIEMLTRALEAHPGELEALVALDELYSAEALWSELLDNLRLRAELTEDSAAKADLRRRIGGVLSDKLENYYEALDAYQMVLQAFPNDAVSIEAARRIGDAHEDLRFRVAEVLLPVLEQTGRAKDRVDVLELRLSVESDPIDRARTLSTQAVLLEKELSRPADALKALLRAVTERPESTEIHAEAERLAELTGNFKGYAAALAERAPSTFDPDVACDLYVRLGRIYRDKLSDPTRSIEAYCRAVEQAGDQADLLRTLDDLYTSVGNHQALADILERRSLLEESERAQADLLYRLATLQLKEFGDPVRALASLRDTLERAPDHEPAAETLEGLLGERDLLEEASEVLEAVYRKRGQTDRLARLLERRIAAQQSPMVRIDLRRELARVLEEECGDPLQALSALEAAIQDGPEDSQVLAEMERLARATGEWVRAAAALRRVVDTRSDLPVGVLVELCLRAVSWLRDKARDAALAEQHLLRALEFEPENDQIWRDVEALQTAPGRERDLVVTLRRRAALQGSVVDREDLTRRAAELALAAGDRETAEAIVRDLLAADDMNAWALSELTRLRRSAGDFKSAFDLMLRQAELAVGDASPRELRVGAAELAIQELKSPEKARALYEQLFEDDPTDGATALALRRLYAEAKLWPELAALLEQLVDIVETGAERAALRIDLARLRLAHFDASDEAMDLLRAVLDEDPNNGDAVVALSELYEKHGRDDDLAELLTGQIRAARSRGDTQAELRFQVRLAEIYETRLGDTNRAIDAFREVLDREPNHKAALTALVRLHQKGGELMDAAQYLARLLDAAQGAEAVVLGLELTGLYRELGDASSSLAVLERCLEMDPSHGEVRSRLEEIYRQEQAWEPLERLLSSGAAFEKTDKDKALALHTAAEIALEQLRDPARAAELLAEVCRLEPDNREYLLELCDAYSGSGRGREAVEVLERIVESYGKRRSKELGEIHLRLAKAYLSEDNAERALQELDNAFRIEPGNVKVLKLLGEVALQTGDHKKAQQVFRALLLQRLDETSVISKAEVFMRLGQIHAELSETPKAIQMLERAIQTDPNLADAQALLDELRMRQS